MNLRAFVILVYVTAFFLSIGGIISIPGEAWKYIADWQKALFAFYILVGFCGILIAYWLYDDEESLDYLMEQKRLLWERVHALSEKIEKST